MFNLGKHLSAKFFNKQESNLTIFHSQLLSYIRGAKTVKWSTMFAVRCMFIWIRNTLMTASASHQGWKRNLFVFQDRQHHRLDEECHPVPRTKDRGTGR